MDWLPAAFGQVVGLCNVNGRSDGEVSGGQDYCGTDVGWW